jgi:hypothetical protein
MILNDEDLEWKGREIARLISKKIVEEVNNLKLGYLDENFRIVEYTLDYLFNDFKEIVEESISDNYNWGDLKRQL